MVSAPAASTVTCSTRSLVTTSIFVSLGRAATRRSITASAVSPGSFNEAIRRRSGIVGFHVHQLRHTFACQWLERGGSLAALQQVLGHASITTTQRYARLTDEAVMREAARIGVGE